MAHVQSESIEVDGKHYLVTKDNVVIGGPYSSGEEADIKSVEVSNAVGEAPIEDYIEYLEADMATPERTGRTGRTDRFGRPVTVQSPTTPNTMRRQGEDINDFLPDWITGNKWYQEQYDKARERDRINQGIPKEDRKFMLFEWIKSIINNPNVSSTQASQILNDAGVMAKDLMMAMNPMGTAYAGEGPGQMQDKPITAMPGIDPNYVSPVVLPDRGQRFSPDIPSASDEFSFEDARTTSKRPDRSRAEEFTQVKIPEIDRWGNLVTEKDRVRAGEFSGSGITSTPPDPFAFEDRKRDSQRRASVPAPMPQSTGLLPPVGRTPYQGPGKRGFSQGRSTRQPRRFGPH